MIYVDIDGTLTIPPGKTREPNWEVINKVKRLIDEGKNIVIWTGGGIDWAEEFCRKYNILPYAVLGKPEVIIDDSPKLFSSRVKRFNPVEFLKVDL